MITYKRTNKSAPLAPLPAWARPAPAKPRLYGKTDHAVAIAYSAKGWGGYGDRDAWEEAHCRYHGPKTL